MLLRICSIFQQVWEDIYIYIYMDFVDGLPIFNGKFYYSSGCGSTIQIFNSFLHLILIVVLKLPNFYFLYLLSLFIFWIQGMPRSIVCDRDWSTFTSLFLVTIIHNGTSFNYISNLMSTKHIANVLMLLHQFKAKGVKSLFLGGENGLFQVGKVGKENIF